MMKTVTRRRLPTLNAIARTVVREDGFSLPLMIVMLLFGSMLIIPFLDFARLRFGDVQIVAEEEEAYFAADAGIEAVLADLRRGTDALDGGYVLPTVNINGYTPVITVTAPPRKDMVPFHAVFLDPEASTSLNPLGSNASFAYVMDNVQPLADFQISWVYTPASNNWRVRVYQGEGTGGSLISNSSGNGSPVRVTVDADDITGGTYTIEFTNNQTGAITAAPFSPVGNPANTWVRVVAFKDYLIESTVGSQTLKVHARQGPGPNQVDSTLLISTWHGPN